MRTTLGRKLLIYTGSIVIFLLLTTFLVLERNQAQAWEDYLFSQNLSFAKLATPELLKRFRGAFPPDEPVEMTGMHDFLGLNSDLVRFSLVATSGRRLYLSSTFPDFSELDLSGFAVEDLVPRLTAGRTTVRTRQLPDGRRLLDLLEPAYSPSGQQVLSVRYLVSYDSVDRRMAEVQRNFLIITAIAICGSLVLVALAARRISRPIKEMTDGARSLAQGDLTTRIDEQGQDELGTLAKAFNDMVESLSNSQSELQQKNLALTQANRDMQSMQEQIMRNERLAAIGQLAAGVSHEIDNPVGIILGHAELLMEDLDEHDPRREDVQAIIDECRRCKRITGGLLGFARPAEADRELVQVGTLIRETIASVRPQKLFKGLALDAELTEEDVCVTGDSDRLRQVLINLLLNAAQAIDGQGRVKVSLDTGEGIVLVHVDDDGPGIPPEDRESVFEPFFSTKAHGEGTGLGLAVCRKLVEAHGGKISAGESPLGGTRLTIELLVT